MCSFCCRISRRRWKSRRAFSKSLQEPLELNWKIENLNQRTCLNNRVPITFNLTNILKGRRKKV